MTAGIEAAALKWPNGCHDPDSCSRHKRCMYVQCRNLNRDIKDEIGEAVAEQNTRPSSSAPVEHREVIAEALWRHEGSSLPAAKRARDAEKFLEQSESTQRKWLGFADAILSLPGSSRDEVLEEAAKVAECAGCGDPKCSSCYGNQIASAIRALKSGVAK